MKIARIAECDGGRLGEIDRGHENRELHDNKVRVSREVNERWVWLECPDGRAAALCGELGSAMWLIDCQLKMGQNGGYSEEELFRGFVLDRILNEGLH